MAHLFSRSLDHDPPEMANRALGQVHQLPWFIVWLQAIKTDTISVPVSPSAMESAVLGPGLRPGCRIYSEARPLIAISPSSLCSLHHCLNFVTALLRCLDTIYPPN
ncbi:hypothetical protein V2G26_020992 [Clonostachys chloroleuca]